MRLPEVSVDVILLYPSLLYYPPTYFMSKDLGRRLVN